MKIALYIGAFTMHLFWITGGTALRGFVARNKNVGGKSILHRNGSAVKRSYRDSRYELLRSIGHAALLHIIYCCALVSTLPHEKTAYSVSRPFTFLDTLHALLFFSKKLRPWIRQICGALVTIAMAIVGLICIITKPTKRNLFIWRFQNRTESVTIKWTN